MAAARKYSPLLETVLISMYDGRTAPRCVRITQGGDGPKRAQRRGAEAHAFVPREKDLGGEQATGGAN